MIAALFALLGLVVSLTGSAGAAEDTAALAAHAKSLFGTLPAEAKSETNPVTEPELPPSGSTTPGPG